MDTDYAPLEERRRDKIRQSTMERHLQTILGGLILAAMLAAGGLLLDLRDRMTRSEEGRIALAAKIGELQEEMRRSGTDRYTATDARREFGDVYKRLIAIEAQLDRQERRNTR